MNQDGKYVKVDFWSLFGRGKEVLKRKLNKLKVRADDDPPDMQNALRTFDFLMDASKSLSEEDIAVLVDNLCDNYPREIDSNVVIARELIAPLLGPRGIIVLNSHHAASSELDVEEPSKLRVASPTSTWRGLGIGKCNIATTV